MRHTQKMRSIDCAEGEPDRDIQYQVQMDADAERKLIKELIAYVDRVAEVHNTLRVGYSVVEGSKQKFLIVSVED